MQDVTEAVMVQTGGKLKAKLFQAKKQNLKEKILDYEQWENAATKGSLNEDRMSEKNKLVKKLKIADINLSFRKMLEEQGFDSIKYFNAADTPATEETTDRTTREETIVPTRIPTRIETDTARPSRTTRTTRRTSGY